MRAFSSFSFAFRSAVETLSDDLNKYSASSHYRQQLHKIKAVLDNTDKFMEMLQDISAALQRFHSDASLVSITHADDDDEEPPFLDPRSRASSLESVPSLPDESDTISVCAQIGQDQYGSNRRLLSMEQYEDDDEVVMEGEYTRDVAVLADEDSDADDAADADDSPVQLAGEAFNGEFQSKDTPGDYESGSEVDENAPEIRPAAFIDELKLKQGDSVSDLIKFKNDGISRMTSVWAQQRGEVLIQAMDTPKGAVSHERVLHPAGQSSECVPVQPCTAADVTEEDMVGFEFNFSDDEDGYDNYPDTSMLPQTGLQYIDTRSAETPVPIPQHEYQREKPALQPYWPSGRIGSMPNIGSLMHCVRSTEAQQHKQDIERFSGDRGESSMLRKPPMISVNVAPQLIPTTINSKSGDASFFASASPPISTGATTKVNYVFDES